MQDFWNEAKSRLHGKIPNHSFMVWIEPLKPVVEQADGLILGCPSSFFKGWVSRHYLSLIQKEMEEVCQRPCRIALNVLDANDGAVQHEEFADQLRLPHMPPPQESASLLHRDFTFDHFVVGSGNDFAYEAALYLASSQGRCHNALFLMSGTGMGKSHLAQAVGNHILSHDPRIRVCYVTAEDFTNGMVTALRNDRIEEFKDKYRRQCDVLLLEDVQFLSGKTKTQDELAYTLDALVDGDKKLIFTSTHHPSDIPKMDEKLRSRLSAGVISDIDTPDFETRVRIIEKKAHLKGVEIPKEVTEYLAGELTQNVRQLESGLIGIIAKASLLRLPIDADLATSVVKNLVRRSEEMTVESIQKLVCKFYKLTMEELLSKSRKRRVSQPRQIAMYLARRHTGESLQSIGKCFNRYHATTLHALGVVERLIREKGPVQKQVEFLSRKLESGGS